ncbi:hypothetical protein IPM09_01155 [Candidatus Saccharibacteria bacterium]|nr:MAG: hypothetical protein IPM09_01155 [Candidatus Saccharibacteria bacterium]
MRKIYVVSSLLVVSIFATIVSLFGGQQASAATLLPGLYITRIGSAVHATVVSSPIPTSTTLVNGGISLPNNGSLSFDCTTDTLSYQAPGSTTWVQINQNNAYASCFNQKKGSSGELVFSHVEVPGGVPAGSILRIDVDMKDRSITRLDTVTSGYTMFDVNNTIVQNDNTSAFTTRL